MTTGGICEGLPSKTQRARLKECCVALRAWRLSDTARGQLLLDILGVDLIGRRRGFLGLVLSLGAASTPTKLWEERDILPALLLLPLHCVVEGLAGKSGHSQSSTFEAIALLLIS